MSSEFCFSANQYRTVSQYGTQRVTLCVPLPSRRWPAAPGSLCLDRVIAIIQTLAHVKSAVHADGVRVRLPAVELCAFENGSNGFSYTQCLPAGSTANTDPQFFCSTDPSKGGRCCPISDSKTRAQAEAGTGSQQNRVGIISNPFPPVAPGGDTNGNIVGFCSSGSDLDCPLGSFCSTFVCVKSAC